MAIWFTMHTSRQFIRIQHFFCTCVWKTWNIDFWWHFVWHIFSLSIFFSHLENQINQPPLIRSLQMLSLLFQNSHPLKHQFQFIHKIWIEHVPTQLKPFSTQTHSTHLRLQFIYAQFILLFSAACARNEKCLLSLCWTLFDSEWNCRTKAKRVKKVTTQRNASLAIVYKWKWAHIKKRLRYLNIIASQALACSLSWLIWAIVTLVLSTFYWASHLFRFMCAVITRWYVFNISYVLHQTLNVYDVVMLERVVKVAKSCSRYTNVTMNRCKK